MLTRELGKVYGFDLTFHLARHNFRDPCHAIARRSDRNGQPYDGTHVDFHPTQLYAQVTDKKVDEDMKVLKANGFNATAKLCEEDFTVGKNRKRIARTT